MSVKKLFKEISDSTEVDITMTDKQISIISAAIEIFAEKGFSATTTSEIAKKAGVAEGTIFHHFKTKKDLLLAIPEYLGKSSFSKDFLEDITNIINNPDKNFEDFIRTIIQNRKSFASANMALIKALFQEIPFQPELKIKISQTVLFPAMNMLSMAIDEFKERGQVGNMPTTDIVNLLFTSIFGYLFTRYIAALELQWDNEKDINYLVQYIMNGICINNKG